MKRNRPERQAGLARRYEAQARRFAILAAYVRGEKAEYIAVMNGCTSRLVHYYVKLEGLSRPQGRPRKAP